MKILLRSPDFVRRLTSRFEIPEVSHWPHHKRLLCLAAMYGYPTWESLVSHCTPSAPPVTFDQDLPSDKARQERWLGMAEQVALVTSIPLPLTLRLVQIIRPMDDPKRSTSKWYEPNEVFDIALDKETDLWWEGQSFIGHILAPPGTMYSVLPLVSDCAKLRKGAKSCEDFEVQEQFALLPWKNNMPILNGHRYYRSNEIASFEPVPLMELVFSPSKHLREVRSFFAKHYPSLSLNEQVKKLDQWRSDIRTLQQAAGMSPRSKDRWRQITIGTREHIGKNWHWPLEFKKDASSEAIKKTQEAALVANDEILKIYGKNPGYI